LPSRSAKLNPDQYQIILRVRLPQPLICLMQPDKKAVHKKDNSTIGRDLVKRLVRLNVIARSPQTWVQSQHPPTQLIRGAPQWNTVLEWEGTGLIVWKYEKTAVQLVPTVPTRTHRRQFFSLTSAGRILKFGTVPTPSYRRQSFFFSLTSVILILKFGMVLVPTQKKVLFFKFRCTDHKIWYGTDSYWKKAVIFFNFTCPDPKILVQYCGDQANNTQQCITARCIKQEH
jgi:hypothetical protein